MITPQDCLDRFGEPTPDFERKNMIVFITPDDLHNAIRPLPAKIYMNRALAEPFQNALTALIEAGAADEINEWGGCFNIRKMRGSNQPSIHSWGIAIDINVSTNQLGQEPQLSDTVVQAFTDNGFDWGGDWARKDGMHFQLTSL